MPPMEAPAQSRVGSAPIPVTKSPSNKFSSLRGIIRIPIKRARGNPGSNEASGGSYGNLTLFPQPHSTSRQTSRHTHQQNQQHSRSQSNDYTPPPSAFGNSPYGQHSRSRSFTMKPYMSQPMLGLGHTRDADGHGGPLDLDGDDTSSYSASPERSPIRQPGAAASAANLQHAAHWTTCSPLRTSHATNAQTHPKSHSTPGRASNDGTAPVFNGISSMPNTAQRPVHTRKLSAQSISNVIVNTTHAGLAAIGLKTRRTSVDGSSKPQIALPSPDKITGGQMSDSKSRPSANSMHQFTQDSNLESQQHATSQAASASTQRRKAPSRPLPPNPDEASSTGNPPLPAAQTISTSTSKTPSTSAESKTPPRPKLPTVPSVLPHAAPSSSPSVLTSGPRSNILQTSVANKSSASTPPPAPNTTSSQNTIAPNYTFPPIRNTPQPNQQQISGTLAHSKLPSGALAPAATTLTTSRNLPKLPTEASDSEIRPHPPVKRSMTTGDESFRIQLPPINPRLTLYEVLESNSARLSPSIIFRPPPLPLINLPMLTPAIGKTSGVLGGDGSAQVHRTRSLAVGSSASRRMMKAMPALPLQGTSRGTRGHEEVDDMEDDDDDDDMDEEDEDESEEISTEPHSASTGDSSMDSETSTDDDGNSELEVLPTDEDNICPSPSSRPSFRWRTMSRNKTPSRSSSYETARGGDSNDHTTVEPSPTEPYYGRPERGPDKRFSRVPHLARVETSGLELDFSIWDQKGMPKTPMDLNGTRVQEQKHGRSGVDKGKAKAREGAVSLFGESEMPNAFFATEDVFQTPIGGMEDDVQNRGGHGIAGERQRVRDDAQSRVVFNGNESLLGGGGLRRVNHDVTKSNQAAAEVGIPASPNGTISAVPGGGVGMDYFYYRNVPPQLPPLGPRRDSSRSRSEKTTTTSGTSMPHINHRISTITTTTAYANPPRGTSPLRTPRPSDFRLNTTTPMSPVLAALPPLVPPKGSEARLSVKMGTLSQHMGLYKMASRSLIDVHGLETKERVEKMMKDEEDAAEREHKTKKRNAKIEAKVLEATSLPVEIHLDEERDVPGHMREQPRTPPHSADPVMTGAAKRSSVLNSALRSEPLVDPPRDDETLNRRISAAPAYDAIPHPLRRRRSMPTFNASTAPPPYPDFSPAMYGLKRDLVILPRDDEGAEKLPMYSNSIYLRAIMPCKMEFTQPGKQAKDRKWRKVLCVLDGTALKLYRCPAATGVSIIGEWWEKKVGAGNFSEPSNNAHTAGGTSGFRITTDTGRSGGPDEDSLGPSRRKSGEGGETGAPVLQRNNSHRPQPSPPQASHVHGHYPSPSVTHASTRSALNLAVQLLKPSPRHGRSHSDVTTSPVTSHSPRASLNLPRSGRTTPTGSSHSSRSPSTHLTTPASSSTSRSSRPTTPSSSISNGAMSASASASRSGISPSANRPQQSTSSSHSSSKNKGKDKHEIPEPDESDLIRSYTMQHAESGLGKDYIKRQHVLRVRLEGEQFLLQANNVDSVIAWIEGLQSAANVALDLDERPMPAGPIFPRRRRRRRPAPAGSNSASVSNVISPSPTIPNGPLAGVRPLERSAGRRS